jgi:hypothetical protein
MDSQRQQTLWAIALENYQAAVLTAQHGWHNVSVACSYYAVYTAMWVALGDPPKRRWEHGGIIEQFVPGNWRTPPMPLERELTRAIRRLYTDRVRADYRAVQLRPFESAARLATARRILQLVVSTLGLSQGGITP